MNKKAQFFDIFLVLITIFFLTYIYLNFHHKYNKFEIKLGEREIRMIEAVKDIEKILFYIDLAAGYAIPQTLFDLAQRGGILEPKCGKYLNYVIWYDGNECYPDIKEVNKNFNLLCNKNLNPYLEQYGLNNNYICIIDNSIKGYAIKNLVIDVGKEISYKSDITKPIIKVSHKYKLPGKKRTKKVTLIVLHHSGDDSAEKTYKTLKKRGLSVHYIVDRDGTIYYVVDENKKALHAGCCSKRNKKCCGKKVCAICKDDKYVGITDRSIGIEIVNTGHKDMEYTPEQYIALNKLIKDIADRWLIPIDDDHIIAHYQITEGKWDPSPNFDWSKIGLPNHPILSENELPEGYGY